MPGVGWPRLFAINGLLLVHHPDSTTGAGEGWSSIGVVHRVVNRATGEQLEHAEYDRLFRALKRALRSASDSTASSRR